MSKNLFDGLSTIVFDLGGVLYDVDYTAVEQALSAQKKNGIAAAADEKLLAYSRQTQPALFSKYETGIISTEEFYDGLRREFALDTSNEELERAWNSMLLGVFPGRNSLVWRLKKKYKLALLSNTNDIHIRHVQPECGDLFGLFDKLFFSYQIGLRKPDPAIFHKVLDDMGSAPHETLFIDDSFGHIETARMLGIRTLWIRHPDSLELAVDMMA